MLRFKIRSQIFDYFVCCVFQYAMVPDTNARDDPSWVGATKPSTSEVTDEEPSAATETSKPLGAAGPNHLELLSPASHTDPRAAAQAEKGFGGTTRCSSETPIGPLEFAVRRAAFLGCTSNPGIDHESALVEPTASYTSTLFACQWSENAAIAY